MFRETTVERNLDIVRLKRLNGAVHVDTVGKSILGIDESLEGSVEADSKVDEAFVARYDCFTNFIRGLYGKLCRNNIDHAEDEKLKRKRMIREMRER